MRDINSLNKVILIGRLGQNPELRYLPQSERAVAKFTLATNERYFNPSTNESDIRAEWHRIVTWGKLAEFCEKYLNQGKQIYLEGKLRTRTWQDREGNKRSTTEIEAQNIILLGKREEISEKPLEEESEPAPQDSPEEEASSEKEWEDEDEVPF
ncbi:MAG: single-stranded DNA-binding protein [Candidatus Aminicenantes bacterium]|nr:single-stranded DNA-binding protein [Candidatus Aminicenantes bacterium]MDH5465896.1 single-stranded DNA-binding protein [Candidatus Aminicenantes bacterium]MDH5704568.1 single-stranded DNA-binding protein [Candidatus Aminicenantes bacterium]